MAQQQVFSPSTKERKFQIVCGDAALDGSNPTAITTKLKTIYSVTLTLAGSSAPGLGTSVLTYATSGSTVNVYAWKPTGALDPTLVASTGTETFSYLITGV